MARNFFGTDGIRGSANTYPMTSEVAMKVGMAAGKLFTNGDHRHRVVIGKDTRLSGYMIESALVSGFVFIGLLIAVNPDARIAGTNLERAGEMPTATDPSGERVDAAYLASLSADAVPTLLARLDRLAPEDACIVSQGLLQRWGDRETSFLEWNLAGERAI